MAYTYLRVGTKPFRSKPPRKGPPCTEPYVRGSNILRDPGFEQFLAWGHGGPDDDMPIDSTNQYNDSTFAKLGTSGVPWQGGENLSSGDNYWKVSTANPRNGTYHARWTGLSSTFLAFAGQLNPVMFHKCPLDTAGWLVAARVEPGDFIRHSAWIRGTVSAGNPKLDYAWEVFDSDGVSVASDTVTVGNLTGTYTKYEFSFFAPANAFYLDIGFIPYPDSNSVNCTFDVDDCELEVS